jgi:hypothetical protein
MNKHPLSRIRVRRKKISVVSLADPPDDVHFWQAQTPQARWRAIELMRQINYGQAATSGRLKRVLEVAKTAISAAQTSWHRSAG